MANYYNDIKEIQFELNNSDLMSRIVELKERQFEDKDVFVDLVDEKPVGGDMAFPVIRPSSGKRMVAICGGERFAVGKGVDYSVEFPDALSMSPNGKVIVFFELVRPADFVEAFHRLSSARASSTL